MFDIIGNLPAIITIVTLEVAGLVAIYGIFDSKYKQREKEKDQQEDRIIALYKVEVGQLNERINAQDTTLQTMRTELASMSGENKLMRDLLTGRDADTAKWRTRTEESMTLISEIGKLAVANGKKMDAALAGISQSSQNIERLAVSIEKHLSMTEKINRKGKKV